MLQAIELCSHLLLIFHQTLNLGRDYAAFLIFALCNHPMCF